MVSCAPMALVARLGSAFGVASAVALVIGVAGAMSGVLDGFIGFRIFGLGVLVGLLAAVLGIVALIGARRTGTSRGQAVLATALGALAVVIAAAAGSPGAGLPAINDITTDTHDPPAFRDPEKTYPGSDFAEQQKAAYPDLGTIETKRSPAEALLRAKAVAERLGWAVMTVDAERDTLEATETTRIFRFVDDVVVRVRPRRDGGSLVDVRSRSRVGRGDVGANARRIRAFKAAFLADS